MPNNLRLLIVEDDPKQIKVYEQQIDAYNKKNETKIIRNIVQNRNQGLKALKEKDYDGAIVDIKLSSTDPKDNGNDIIRQIKKDLRFPVRVYTAFDDLDDDLRVESEFYKIYKRGGGRKKTVQDILEEIVAIFKTGITKIIGKRGTIEGYLKEIFWKHLSDSFDDWVEEARTESGVEKILLRYTLSHLQEYLDKNEGGEFDEYHPAEVYIINPINDSIHTGLILKKNDDAQFYIVLTPLCDLAQKKAKKIVLALIEKHDMQYVKDLKKKIKNSKCDSDEKEKAVVDLKALLSNTHSLKYHFLPVVRGIGGFINFQKITSFTKSEIETNFSFIATVTDKFCKEIISRFTHYYSRQGQPNFNFDNIYKTMIG